MFFEIPLLIPADTPEAEPATEDAELCAGIVSRVAVQFPAGCSGMVYVSIWRGGHPLWPTNIDEGFAGEDSIIDFPESYTLDEPPYTLELRGWGPDTTYNHTVTFRFSVLPLPELVLEDIELPGGLTLADILG